MPTCHYCQARIVWRVTASGASMPLDATPAGDEPLPVPDGNAGSSSCSAPTSRPPPFLTHLMNT